MRRVFGTTLLMAFAIAALAGAADASASQFRAEEYPVGISGGQTTPKQILKTEAGTINCVKSTFSDSESAPSTFLTLTPSESGCVGFGRSATVVSNGCTWRMQSTNNSAPYTGTMELECPLGQQLEIQVPSLPCTVSLLPQTPANTVSYENTGSGALRAVTATWSLTGVAYIESGTGCLGAETGKLRTSGTYSGATSLTGAEGYGMYIANEQQGETLTPEWTAESYPAIFEAKQVQKWVMNVGPLFSCKAVQGAGTINGRSSSIQLSQNWSGCTEFGRAITPEWNGCTFSVNVESKSAGSLGVVCPAGKEIKLNEPSLPCVARIPAQSNAGSVTLKGEGTGASRTIALGLNVGHLAYTAEGCLGPGGEGTFYGGITGSSELKGFNSTAGRGAQQGIYIH